MKTNRVVNNAAWIIACRVAESVLHLVIIMLTSRYLGPSNYGIINYASSLVAFMVPVMQLGVRNILIKEMVTFPREKGTILGTALCMNLVSSLLCVVGITAFAQIANPNEPETVIVCLLYSFSLVFQAVQVLQYWFQEQLLSKYISLSMLAAYVVVSAYEILILVLDKNILWFAVCDGLKHFLIALFLVIQYRQFGGDRLHLSWQTCRRMFAQSKYYILSNLMVTVFAQTDKLMLKQMVGDAVTGYYSAASNCANLTNFVFLAIVDSARPGIFQSKQVSEEKFEKRITQLYAVIGAVSLVQCLGFTLFAQLITDILYGADYAMTVPLLQIVVWYTTFAHLGLVRDIWILAEEKQHLLWTLNIFGALSNVALNLVLIPRMGGAGAALASVAAQFIANIGMCFLIPSLRRSNYLLLRSFHPKALINLIRSSK